MRIFDGIVVLLTGAHREEDDLRANLVPLLHPADGSRNSCPDNREFMLDDSAVEINANVHSNHFLWAGVGEGET